MLLFTSLEQFAESDGVELWTHYPEAVEVEAPKISGYMNIYLKNGSYYLHRNDGLYRFDESALRFERINKKKALRTQDFITYYLPHTDHYYRIGIETKSLRSIYYRMKRAHADFDHIRDRLYIRRLRSDGNRFYLFWQPVPDTAVAKNKQLIDFDAEPQILVWSDRHWVESELTVDGFHGLPKTYRFNETLAEILGVRPTDYRAVMPGESYFDDPFLSKRHLVDVFGSMYVPTVGYRIKQSPDLLTWDRFTDLSSAHRGIFDGEFTDLFSTTPMFDSAPSFFYSETLGRYYFYNRANITANCRYIQLSVSKNGSDWSKYQTLRIPGFDYHSGQNYYTPSMFLYHDDQTVVSVNYRITHPTAKKVVIEEQFLHSSNGVDFQAITLDRREHPDRKELHHVEEWRIEVADSMRFSCDRIEWFSFEVALEGKTWLRSIRRDGFASVGRTGTGVGSATTHRLRFDSVIRLNYRCAESGWLEVTSLDGAGDEIGRLKLTGDSTEAEFTPGVDTGALRFRFSDSEIFSVVGVDRLPDHRSYQTLRFNYRRMYDLIKRKPIYGSLKSGWQTITLPQPARRLIGRPIVSEQSAVIEHDVEYTDGSTGRITLINTRDGDQLIETKLVPDYFFVDRGAPGAVYGVELVDPILD